MTTEHTRRDLRAERDLEITQHDAIARHVPRAAQMRTEALAQLLGAASRGAARLLADVASRARTSR